MPSLLIVSSNPFVTEQIERIAEAFGIRVTAVASVKVAMEWLTRQRFDMLLIDSSYEPATDNSTSNESNSAISLITFGWQHNSLMIGGLFHLGGKVADEWHARLLGARVYAGPRALSKIQQTLEFLPTFLPTTTANTVMFVDDLDSPRNIIMSYIEALGYPSVIGAKSATQAMDLLDANPENFFLIITDINMPEINGIQLIATIRNDPRLKHLPVTVLTSNPTVQNLIECLRNGATGFLAKPPRKRELSRELEKAKRMLLTKQSPRICKPEDAHLLEEALRQVVRV